MKKFAMTFVVILSAILVLLLSLLWIPIILTIDTTRNEYCVQLKGLAKANVEGHPEEFIRIKIRIARMNFFYYPLRAKDGKPKKRRKKKKKTDEIKSWSSTRKKGRNFIRFLRSFRVRRFHLNLDLEDPLLNAKLFPVFALLNHYVGSFRINFQQRNEFILQLENRPIYIISSFINL